MPTVASPPAPSPLWARIAIVVAFFGIGLNAVRAVRIPPVTLEEGQRMIDERIAELNAIHPHRNAAQRSPEQRRQFGIANGAANRLELLSAHDALLPIEEALFGAWDDDDDPQPPAPEARRAALAHPPLRELLDAWLAETIEPEHEPTVPYRAFTLQRFTLEELVDVNLHGNPGDVAAWVRRSLDLIETQLLQQNYDSWAVASLMLSNLATTLERQPKLHLSPEDRRLFGDRVSNLASLVAPPENVHAMLERSALQQLRDELSAVEDDDQRGVIMESFVRIQARNDRTMAAVAIESDFVRNQTMRSCSAIDRVPDEAVPLIVHGEGLWDIYRSAIESEPKILRRLKLP